jgi:PilZ domain
VNKRTAASAPADSARRESRFQTLSDLHLKYEGWPNEISLRPPDLSVHGMFVNTATHFPEGAIVNLRFRLKHADIEIQTRGEVRYCLEGVGIGIEFVDLEADATRAIEKELKLLSRTPRRASRNGRRKRI